MTVGDPDRPVTGGRESLVPAAVSFERTAHRVEGPAVDLGDEAVVSPEEVDFVPFDADVRLGLGQASPADQPERDAFEVGAGETALGFECLPQCCRSPVPRVTAQLLIEGMRADAPLEARLVEGAV